MDTMRAATDIVSAAASRLCLDMRFLTRAVLSLRTSVVPGDGVPRCNGRTVVFHSDTVVSSFRRDQNSVTRDLAHCVLHCVLGHDSPSNPPETDLAEDMVVEYVLDCLDTPHTSVPERDDRMFACERQFAKAGAPSPAGAKSTGKAAAAGPGFGKGHKILRKKREWGSGCRIKE